MSEIVYGMPASEYHALPDIGSTMIKDFLKSPMHYWANHVFPIKPKKESAAFAFGSAFHTFILEQEKFNDLYIVRGEGIDGRTKDGKKALDALASSGKQVITNEDFLLINEMASSVSGNDDFLRAKNHPLAVFEASIFHMLENGLRLKVRPDLMIPPCRDYPRGLIVDVKTTKDASQDGFAREALRYGYDISAAHYCDVFARHFGVAGLPEFKLMACEKTYPCPCALYDVPEILLFQASTEVNAALHGIAECHESGKWPGYKNGVLSVPEWRFKEVEEEEEISYVK